MENRRNIILRYFTLYALVAAAFLVIIVEMISIQLEAEKWVNAIPGQKKSTVSVKPTRGNIYSHDGHLMASSIPTYRIYMDTKVEALHLDGGKLFYTYIDSISYALSNYFGDRSKQAYKTMITNAYNRGDRGLLLYPKRISYVQLKDVKKFPLYNQGKYKGGLIAQEDTRRVRPYGSLALRTVGNVYALEEKGGYIGLEKTHDKYLRGEAGVSTVQRAATQKVQIIDKEAIAGADVISTIDVDIQEIAENSLLKMLNTAGAESGYVVMMEVKTGAVRAIVNMYSDGKGGYYEKKNGAVADLVEPGSTFKTATLMVALEDGVVTIKDSIDVGNGKYKFGNREMRDHNHHKGGYGKISVQNALEASSNVGISRIINENYGKNPTEFVEKLYALGIADPIGEEIPGTPAPIIRKPNDTINRWSNTTLPWMSIGYEVQIPPIYTLTFYNAIANKGKMIKPFFTHSTQLNGEVIEEYSTEVIRRKICSDNTLEQIQTALEGVVWSKTHGTAKGAQSDKIRIAGKTGTALIASGSRGYTKKEYQISFCGYFPIEKPMYSAICVIRRPRKVYPSGGAVCGPVIRDIAEKSYALRTLRKTDDIEDDTTFVYHQAFVKSGTYNETKDAAQRVGIRIGGKRNQWVKNTLNEDNELASETLEVLDFHMPNVVGMGAADAIYAIERTGMRVEVRGEGRVRQQSIRAGTKATRGRLATIVLR